MATMFNFIEIILIMQHNKVVYSLSNDNCRKILECLMYMHVYIIRLQVLVGESIVKQEDPGKGITQLFGKDISLWIMRSN